LQLHAKLTTLLYPVVKNLAVTILRKRGRALSNDALLDQAATPAPAGTNPSRPNLPAALGALPESQRELLLMRFVDDLSLGEISEALSIPLGTVKSRLHDAVTTLRNDPRTQSYFEP
jgi:RNA polymerase sigma-70 factor (ECF subfamily)